MDNDLPMVVFGMQAEGNIARAVQGEKIGTLVSASACTADRRRPAQTATRRRQP